MKSSDPTHALALTSSGELASGFSIDQIKIGRASLSGIRVIDRAGAINFMETLRNVLERTMRRRAGNHLMFPADLPGAAPTRLISEEVALYLDYCKQRRISPSYIRNTTHAFRILIATCEDIPVSQVNHEHMVAFWDAMRWWPSKMLKRGQLVGLSDVEIIAAGKAANVPAPADKTLNLRMQIIATFFGRLKKMRVISHSPCEGIGSTVKRSNRVIVRRPFSDDELKAIFDRARFTAWAKFPHHWWMPMIGLFTGARVNEVAQMKVKDIECINGIWCFHIRVSMDDDRVNSKGYNSRQQLKGNASIRTIPIAQQLLDAGLLDYVEDIKQIPHPRLFPHLYHRIDPETGEPDGIGYSRSFRAHFSAYVRKVVPDNYVAFHAFRHTFCTSLQRLDRRPPAFE